MEKLKHVVLSGPRSNMPYRVLKAVVDMMGHRYSIQDFQPLSLEEILAELKLTELRTDIREWLQQVWTCTCTCTKWESLDLVDTCTCMYVYHTI